MGQEVMVVVVGWGLGGVWGGQKLYIVKLPNKYNTYNGIL